MKRIPIAKQAVALPLLGLFVAWLAFMGGSLADLYVPQPTWTESGETIYPAEIFHIGPYLYLLGIAAGAISSRTAQNLALKAHDQLGQDNKLARAAHRFATLGVVVGLAAGAIFAIGNFMSAFNSYSGRAENIGMRLLNVYVPILLATALVVFVLLSAFVFKQGSVKSADGKKVRMSETQKALALGYAVPILATAVAIIFGLVVYDVTRTNLQVWVWVIIIAIVVVGVVFGTRFANRARTAKAEKPKPKTALAAGAASLNFVLSIVFGTVVSFMAFTFGSAAMQKLQTWSQVAEDCVKADCQSTPTMNAPTWQWLIEDLAPAKVLLLLAIVGIYLTITERNKEAK